MNAIKEFAQTLRFRKQRDALARIMLSQATRGKPQRPPMRSRTKTAGRRNYLALARQSQPDSMLNMGKPAGHITLPRFPSERERTMFAAHLRRREAGWVHG